MVGEYGPWSFHWLNHEVHVAWYSCTQKTDQRQISAGPGQSAENVHTDLGQLWFQMHLSPLFTNAFIPLFKDHSLFLNSRKHVTCISGVDRYFNQQPTTDETELKQFVDYWVYYGSNVCNKICLFFILLPQNPAI